MSDVGYGKPPLHSRFQKGKSGNTKGRPKGSCNTLKLLNDVLEQKITITQASKNIQETCDVDSASQCGCKRRD